MRDTSLSLLPNNFLVSISFFFDKKASTLTQLSKMQHYLINCFIWVILLDIWYGKSKRLAYKNDSVNWFGWNFKQKTIQTNLLAGMFIWFSWQSLQTRLLAATESLSFFGSNKTAKQLLFFAVRCCFSLSVETLFVPFVFKAFVCVTRNVYQS